MSFDFNAIRIEKPSPIENKVDDLKQLKLKILKHFFKITAPYFWGPKHTDIWSIGRFVTKVTGKECINTQCADGKWISLPLPVYTSHFLYGPDHKRFNRDNITPIMKKFAQQGSVAIDVGASCGQEVVALSHAVGEEGQVYCFEPSASFDALLRTVALNGLKNVTCVHAGCGNENGFIAGSSDQKYFIGDQYHYADSGVPVVRIDDFLEHINETRKVSLIKIDTDGFEYEVIKGLQDTIEKNNAKVIAEFEPHFEYSGAKSSDVLKRYEENGFEICKIQTSYIPLTTDEIEQYIQDMKNPENMIAHDVVLKKRA